ncbi:1-deoxy-D-xylulose-5-phosphate synthase [Candidatus Pacearchaeota archaeon]|nr:1-deoxy-D-xylulose-5-phosphate synthase [Candidatus Pacearchaeota archaeon]
MRNMFFSALSEVVTKDDGTFLLTGDLGFGLFDSFRDKWPDKFYDIGVAESNMIGIAAGLSLSGKNVYCYSIIPFLVMRAYEHIRLDIAYNNLNVKLVGVGGGFSYGFEGFTHFGLEDLCLMSALPNMTVVVPADPIEAQQLAKISCQYQSPLYIRLGRTGDPVIHDKTCNFEIGKGMLMSEGKDLAIFAIGNMVLEAKRAVDLLQKQGISATLINMHTLKPLDRELVKQCAASHDVIFSIEEHYAIGGLGAALTEVLCETGHKGKFKKMCIPDKLNGFVGDANYLKEKYELSAKKIASNIIKELE